MTGGRIMHSSIDPEDHGAYKYRTNLKTIIILSIVGILVGVAVKQFIDLKTDVDRAVAESIAHQFAAAAALNYAACSLQAPSANPRCIESRKITCSIASASLLLEDLPADVTISGKPSACKVSKNGVPAGRTVVIMTLN